jgi:RND family efflux transporter MFP subunit
MQADTATVDVPRTYPGQVYVEQDVAVAARSAGVLESLVVNLGSVVRAGEPLATVESKAQEIEAARARERLERARSTLNRARILAKSGGVTSIDTEQVAGEFHQAELSAQKAEHDLVLTRITAPFDGVVTARYAKPRQLVADGDTLFRIAETGPQLVRIRVGEPAARMVRRGDRATVIALSGVARVAGSVVLTAPALDATSGTREVILQLAGTRFLTGENVAVQMGTERRIAVVAPREAISPDGYVLVAEGGRTMMRPVTVGAEVPGGRLEVVTGLARGERLAPVRR